MAGIRSQTRGLMLDDMLQERLGLYRGGRGQLAYCCQEKHT